MRNGVEPLFKAISDSIRSFISEPWTSARLEAIFYSDSSSYKAGFTRKTDGAWVSIGLPDGSAKTIRTIRQLFKDSGEPIWGEIVIDILPSGKYDVTYRYDRCDENGDTIFDEGEYSNWHLTPAQRAEMLNTPSVPVRRTPDKPPVFPKLKGATRGNVPRLLQSWERIHSWLADNAPRTLAQLNPGASDADIISAERAFGFAMPSEWKELYSIHNGLNDEPDLVSLFYGMKFFPLDRVIHEHEETVRCNKKTKKNVQVEAADLGVRLDSMHNPRWIAMSHDGNETLLHIDMDPTSDGTIGQVIFVDHAHSVVILLAPSVAGFVAAFADDLEDGLYALAQDALDDGNEFLSPAEVADVVNWAHSPTWKRIQELKYPEMK